MATVSISHCGEHGGRGCHITATITTAKGAHTTTFELADLLKEYDREELARMVITNMIIRARKAGALTAEALKLAVDGVVFQEI